VCIKRGILNQTTETTVQEAHKISSSSFGPVQNQVGAHASNDTAQAPPKQDAAKAPGGLFLGARKHLRPLAFEFSKHLIHKLLLEVGIAHCAVRSVSELALELGILNDLQKQAAERGVELVIWSRRFGNCAWRTIIPCKIQCSSVWSIVGYGLQIASTEQARTKQTIAWLAQQKWWFVGQSKAHHAAPASQVSCTTRSEFACTTKQHP
jgi:hypothetical protein